MQRAYFKIASLIIAGSWLSSCNGPLPGGKANIVYIEGVVTDSTTGNPIPGVTIEVSSNGKVPDTGDKTDADGKYSVYNTGAVIVATKRGYQAYYATLDTIDRTATVTYNIKLTSGSATDTIPPSVPMDSAIFPKNNYISWSSSDVSGVAGYTVYRGDTPIYTTFYTGFWDYSVIDGSPYCYSIAAFDASGNESPRSGEMCYAAASGGSPHGPYDVNIYVSSSSDIGIDWIADEIRPHNIYRDGVLVKSLTAGEGASSDNAHYMHYTDPSLSPGVKYCYFITEVMASGETQPTPQVCITTWTN